LRAFNRVLSGFLAAVLIVAGVLAILEICRAALGQPPAVVQWPKLLPKLRSNSYRDAGPILVCVGLAVVGLLILISGVKRGKPYALPAGSTAPGVRTEINRRSLERGIRAAVQATERVESGRVTLRRRTAVIVVRANSPAIEGLDADIRQRVETLLASIRLVDPPRLKIKTRPAPPPPTSTEAPVGVGAPQPARVGAAAAGSPAPPITQPAPPPAVPEPGAEASTDAAWARRPEPPQPAPRAEREPEPAPELRQQPKQEPVRDPAPKPEAAEPPTTRLDDLLSADPEDESK
jgi:hypothetical protein